VEGEGSTLAGLAMLGVAFIVAMAVLSALGVSLGG
jgi:hypothetical protein